MKKVWICQCLCGPERHCILAAVDMADGEAEAIAQVETHLRTMVGLAVRSGVIGNECALCGARQENWVYETKPTVFSSLTLAMPELRRLEAENRVTSTVFGGIHKTDRPN